MPDLVSSLKSLLLVNTSIEENRQQEQQQIGDQQQSLLGGTECLNGSVVPDAVKDEELWNRLTENDSDRQWYRLFIHSGTLQWSPLMMIPRGANLDFFCQEILAPLINNNCYFTSSLGHVRHQQTKVMLLNSSRCSTVCSFLGISHSSLP